MSKVLPRHALRQKKGFVKQLSIIVASLLIVTLAALSFLYFKFDANIEESNVNGLLGAEEERPTKPVQEDPNDEFAGKDLNILVMGTDSRDGDNSELAGPAEGMRSDSTFLVHVSGDRNRVEVISIPRDSIVDIPSCQLSDGSMTKPQNGKMFNTAFSIGAGNSKDITTAAACTRKTFELNTGVRTDEHIVVKMDGVKNIIDILGGVTICLPEAMVSPKANLDLPQGQQTLTGEEALGFLRARTGQGNGLEAGSDLSRIDRQQDFLNALMNEVKSKNLLSDSPTLLQTLDAGTKSLSISSGLASIRSLAGLGFSLKDLNPENFLTQTVPNAPAPWDKNRVVWTEDADVLWQRIINDEGPVVEAETVETLSPSAPSESPMQINEEDTTTLQDAPDDEVNVETPVC